MTLDARGPGGPAGKPGLAGKPAKGSPRSISRLRRPTPLACAPTTRQERRRQRRAVQRVRTQRAISFAPTPVTAGAAAESLADGDTGTGWSSSAAFALLVALSLGLHASVGLAIWRGHFAPPPAPKITRITAQVRERPAPPPRQEARPAPAPPPKLARVTPRAAAPKTASPPTATPPPAAAPPPVKVVGLSLESTSEAGEGPAFAVGDTLAGSTADTASTPRPKLADADALPVAATRAPGPNRRAQGVPSAGSVLTPPKRLHEVKPHYPDALRAAGVEADVLLVVSLDEKGKVLTVTVGKGSGDPSFDEAARAAALQERFSPALRDGTPVPTTFSFTTHFRLDLP